MGLIGMAPTDVLNYATSYQFIGKGILREMLQDNTLNVRKRLTNCGVPAPLTPLQCVSYFNTWVHWTILWIHETIFGIPPSVRELRSARWSLLSSFPRFYTMDATSNELVQQTEGRFTINYSSSRNVQCTCIELQGAVRYYFESALNSDSLPKTPHFPFISDQGRLNTVVVLISIDSGGGTI